MQILRRIADLRAALRPHRQAGVAIGLVPTMGALHDGHLALIAAARARAGCVVATLFVNPRQFAPHEDFAAYPRDEAQDAEKLAAVGCDYLFAPAVAEIYPPGFASAISVGPLGDRLEGAIRPHFFNGVATIVAKLLIQSLPDCAFFGEKDYQQLLVIRRLVADLDLPVEIVGVPTRREADGLAMSSRNRYLDAQARRIAAALPKILAETAAMLRSGVPAAAPLAAAIAGLLKAGFSSVDYLELCDERDLRPLAAAGPGARLFAAARLGSTRLIDNWPVPPPAFPTA